MRERKFDRRVALGVAAVFCSAVVIGKVVGNNENQQPNLNPPTALEQFRSVMTEIIDLATPQDFGGNNFPSASRFD